MLRDLVIAHVIADRLGIPLEEAKWYVKTLYSVTDWTIDEVIKYHDLLHDIYTGRPGWFYLWRRISSSKDNSQ